MADNSDDGSVLVLLLIVKIASFNFFVIPLLDSLSLRCRNGWSQHTPLSAIL
jgi:hypothetical protein